MSDPTQRRCHRCGSSNGAIEEIHGNRFPGQLWEHAAGAGCRRHPAWCARGEKPGDPHVSRVIPCQPDGDELVAIAVSLWQVTDPLRVPLALTLEITQDGRTELCLLPLGQARVTACAIRKLLHAAKRDTTL